MADLQIRINAGETPIVVGLGEYIGTIWVPRPGNNWIFSELGTYTISDLADGTVTLRAWEQGNPACYEEISDITLSDEITTTTSSTTSTTTEEGSTTTSSSTTTTTPA